MQKAKCLACGFEAHNLKPHFLGEASPSCTYTLEAYLSEFPDSLITSAIFDQKFAERIKAVKAKVFTPVKYNPKAVFGIDMGPSFKVTGFLERTESVPEIDPGYVFPEEATKIILLGLEMNKPVMLHGPTGSGKTSTIEQIAARINMPFTRINHHADMYSQDVVGMPSVQNGATGFKEGPLPIAMQQPGILCLDEWDAIQPEIGMMYQSVLERTHKGTLGNLTLTSDGARVVRSHPMFRIIATSNTCGLGDEKGHYQGTQHQNLAFVSRFLLRVKLDYLKKDHEASILKQKFPDLSEKEIEAFVTIAQKIRTQYEAGKINVPYSLRDLINYVDMYLLIADPRKAIVYTCSSILPFTDFKSIDEIVQRIFEITK